MNDQTLHTRSDWYNAAILILVPGLIEAYEKFRDANDDIAKILRSLIFRVKKLIYAVNCISIEHYFNTLKKEPIDINQSFAAYDELINYRHNYKGLAGFMDMDNYFIFFYHVEYIISLVTGIFDNLALLSNTYYSLNFPSRHISLSNNSGKNFLNEIRLKDPNLKSFVDTFRNFINLIYTLREKVVHKEGLDGSIHPLVPNWNSFIRIDDEINYYIKNCGDSKHLYKYITNWGIIKHQDEKFIDPFFFSQNILNETVAFVRGYIPFIK
ncbi:MAG: hypothetical protein R2685_16255 [Candidatus Nitrosocosmicus sp.]|nr:hypothetical protein [Candidatus Nitrosocosmicus sp.]